MNWLSRFSDLVNEIRQNSNTELLSFQTFPPVQEIQLLSLEKKYNIIFPKQILSFYKQTNGLQLNWVLDDNEDFSKEKNVLPKDILPWDIFEKNINFEDGVIMLLPLEIALEKKVFDAFSHYHQMIFSLENFHLTVSEDDHFSNDFLTTDFESYLEFLIASKGLVSRRSFFYSRSNDYSQDKMPNHISTPNSFWKQEKILNLKQAALKSEFFLCDQIRFSESKINRLTLRQLAQKSEKTSSIELEGIVNNHHQFLMADGIGGSWQVIEIRGIVTAFYQHKIEPTEGKQANFERKNLTNISFEKIELPFANFCSVFAEKVNFSKSNFKNCIFTDAFLQNASFYNSILTNVDFSRSNLKNVNFENCDLRNVDFENCDLRGANFKNTKIDGASFVGTILI